MNVASYIYPNTNRTPKGCPYKNYLIMSCHCNIIKKSIKNI